MRLGGLGVLDPVEILPAAHVAAYVSTSSAVFNYGLPQLEVRYDTLACLSQLDPACHSLCSPLREEKTVGLQLSANTSNHNLFDAWSSTRGCHWSRIFVPQSSQTLCR